jgi:polysaccharide export outer membrane protein
MRRRVVALLLTCTLIVTTRAASAPAPRLGPDPQAPDPQPLGESFPDYKIGPDDILRVTVYGHDDLTQTVLVQSDGTFIFPLIGRVKAADSTPPGLASTLASRLSQGFVRSPQVSVVVQEYRSQRVFVVGEVVRPGPYPLSGRTSLVQVLASAGPTPNAGAEIVVVRPPPGSDVREPMLPGQASGKAVPGQTHAQVIRITVRDLEAGDLSQNLELLPGDTVFVPQAPKVFVTGEVRNPGAYGHFPGMTARQLISVAGGLTQYGSDGRLRVVRQAQGRSQEDKIRLDDPVRPGETLVVRRKLF